MSKKDLNPTGNDLPAKTRRRVTALLNQVLADLTDLASQSKQAHWNVRGGRFFMFHELFDKVAAMADANVDDIAERITALGGTALGTVRMAAAASELPEWPVALKLGDRFVGELAKRFTVAANSVRAGIDKATEIGDADTADLLTGVSRELDKALWFLEASA